MYVLLCEYMCMCARTHIPSSRFSVQTLIKNMWRGSNSRHVWLFCQYHTSARKRSLFSVLYSKESHKHHIRKDTFCGFQRLRRRGNPDLHRGVEMSDMSLTPRKPYVFCLLFIKKIYIKTTLECALSLCIAINEGLSFGVYWCTANI